MVNLQQLYTQNLKPKIKDLDKLWIKAIKLRAGMKSELKHIPDAYIASHHILGKATLALRYSLDNGVCITTGQHHYVAHNTGRSEKFKQWALNHRGVSEEQLRMMANNKTDRFFIKAYLESKIKEFSSADS